jgi:hypothetical protein
MDEDAVLRLLNFERAFWARSMAAWMNPRYVPQEIWEPFALMNG